VGGGRLAMLRCSMLAPWNKELFAMNTVSDEEDEL